MSEPGDFLFVPPDVPHDDQPERDQAGTGVVARNDPEEQDKVEPYRVTAST